MTQTTGIVRGGLVINKILIDYNKKLKNVELDTSYLGLDMKKSPHKLY